MRLAGSKIMAKVPRTFKKTSFPSLDIDECSINTDDCDPDATCTDNPGGYDCNCNLGYAGDGFTCTGTFQFFGHVRIGTASLFKVIPL